MKPAASSLIGLLFAPAVLAAAAFAAPRVHVSSGAADLIAFAGATSTSLLALVLLSRGSLPKAANIALGVAPPAIVGLLALLHVSSLFAFVLVSTCIVLFGHALGRWIGSNIEHPGHLLPACVVASIADLVSVLHPSGPSHNVLQSETALSLLAVSFPVLGTRQIAPTIGVGDLLFIALLLAVARRHELSWLRMALACAVGIACAGAASYLLNLPVPALPAIGLAVVLAFRQARSLRPRDRRTAVIFMVGAAVVAGVLIATRYLPT